jgi:hypothetical protein
MRLNSNVNKILYTYKHGTLKYAPPSPPHTHTHKRTRLAERRKKNIKKEEKKKKKNVRIALHHLPFTTHHPRPLCFNDA